MRCHKIKNAFFKDSELSDRERKKLKNHLLHCESCRKIFNETRRLSDTLQALKSEPILDDAQVLTNDIMRSLRQAQTELHATAPYSQKLLDFMTHRNVKLALGTTLVLLLAIFCVQEATILRRLHHLEQRMQQQTLIAAQSQSLLFGLQKRIKQISADTDNEQIIIDKESLEKLIQSYDTLKIENKLLSKMLEEKFLTIADVSLGDGLTRKELKTLVDNDDLLKKIYNL